MLRQEPGVVQDQPVGHAGEHFVAVGVHVLEVVQEQVHQGQDLQELLRPGKARGVQADMYAAVLQPAAEVQGEGELAHSLPAGNGDAAPVFKKGHVLQERQGSGGVFRVGIDWNVLDWNWFLGCHDGLSFIWVLMIKNERRIL